MQFKKDDLRAFVAWYKSTAFCADCNGQFPPKCMEFDHVPERGPKLGSVMDFCSRCDVEGLYKEIAKCDVVCAICHRLRTDVRGGKKKSAETRRKMSEAAKNRPSNQVGLKRSAASRAKMAEAQRRRYVKT